MFFYRKCFFTGLIIIICSFFITDKVEARVSGSSTTAADEEWAGDMEHKVDATIRVLEVVKEELKKEQQQQRQTASAPVKPDLAATLKTTIDRVKRLWDEIQEIRREEAARTGRPLPDDAASGQWASDMSDKLQKSIEAMQVLKGELDEMKKDEAFSAN